MSRWTRHALDIKRVWRRTWADHTKYPDDLGPLDECYGCPEARRSYMRSAYRAKTKHRRRNR